MIETEETQMYINCNTGGNEGEKTGYSYIYCNYISYQKNKQIFLVV